MSDFGTMVSVHRPHGVSTTDADEKRITQVVNELVAPHRDRINEFAEFNLSFGSSSKEDGSEGVMVGLTDYWLGDEEGNEGLDSEVLIERDRPLAEDFGRELQERLGPEFEVEVYCGHW